MTRRTLRSTTGTVAPQTRRGLAVLFGIILVVGLAILFTADNVFALGRLMNFPEFIVMAIVGFAYPRITGINKKTE